MTAIEVALDRATRPVADDGDGWETTAAVLAHEVKRLRSAIEKVALEWRDEMKITAAPGQDARVLASDVAADRLLLILTGDHR